MHIRLAWLLAPGPLLLALLLALLLVDSVHATATAFRAANLDESQAVSSQTSSWRAFACMVPFTASDKTPLLMLYGGTSDPSITDPLSVASSGLNKLQVFDTTTSKWYAPNTANTPTIGPVLPGCGAGSGSIWVYDTQYGVPNRAATAVRLLDSVHWSWSAPTEKGQLPVTRFGAAFANVPDTNQFYMHGGIPLSVDKNLAADPPAITNNMDILSPSTISWNYASNGPARKYHTMCYMSSIKSLVMFGGSDMDISSYNDVKLLSTTNNIWQYAVNIEGEPPSERILHSAVCTEDTMYVFGGMSGIGAVPSDSAVWMLKASGNTSFKWSTGPINTEAGLNPGPTARAGHSVALHKNNMYIYGGVGPSGQDDTMYKLDLEQMTWSQTSVTGSGVEAQQTKSKVRTAVIIAAVVSSVLGAVTIGITIAVLYRIIRRHHRNAFGGIGVGGAARRHGQANGCESSDDGEDDGAVNMAMSKHKGESRRGTGNSNYPKNEGIRGGRAYSDIGGGAAYKYPSPDNLTPVSPSSMVTFGFPPVLPVSHQAESPGGSANNSSNTRTPTEQNLVDDSNFDSATTIPASIATEINLLSAKEKIADTSRSSTGGNRMMRSMRAHAQSLSSRFSPSRLSQAFGDSTNSVPHSPSVLPQQQANDISIANRNRNRSRRAATAGALSTGVYRQPAIIDQNTANNMYGSEYSRRENEYRQAEAINQILLSGQPIPVWLRDAVNQAQGNDLDLEQPQQQQQYGQSQSDHNMDVASGSETADPEKSARKLGIVNKPKPRRKTSNKAVT
ncbi:hypothetical protein LPJ66_000061 [Kickxella alabastrina]|uniref:Uncharacterized protein n=1 Tax=Kickxella alabastrina TaxID=61397 RepID=A0ACC1IX69_9FUNG|nr:hypothetical protein LPJ66_000061 [Kickxella alabastrina]